ncbi:MAG: hypothetical protein AAF353_19350 [Pseudomonadota bacterium]
MKRLTTCVFVFMLVLSGQISFGALVMAQELRDPMQPPPYALKKIQQAKWAKLPKKTEPKVDKPKDKPLSLTSILISNNRKIAIIGDQMLSVGDSIKDAKLVKLTRESARLIRKGKVINLSLHNKSAAISKKAVESDL